jgi:hypothetical protein
MTRMNGAAQIPMNGASDPAYFAHAWGSRSSGFSGCGARASAPKPHVRYSKRSRLGRQHTVPSAVAQSQFAYEAATLALAQETITCTVPGLAPFTRQLDRERPRPQRTSWARTLPELPFFGPRRLRHVLRDRTDSCMRARNCLLDFRAVLDEKHIVDYDSTP